MNFKLLHVSTKPTLINFDNVCEITEFSGNTHIYFNVTNGDEILYSTVDESVEEIGLTMLGRPLTTKEQ